MHKVWTVFKGPDGGDAYLGTEAFIERQHWCFVNCPVGEWGAYMGYFTFTTEAMADAFRAEFGENKPSRILEN